MQVFELTEDMVAELDRAGLRRGELRVFGIDPAECEAAVAGVCLPLMNAAGLPLTHFHQFRWFVRELARKLRTKQAHELRFEMESLLRKWTGLGLDQRLLEALLRESLTKLAGPGAEVRNGTQV
jgi:hypothetical protein